MIVSIIEKESEHEGIQSLLVCGSSNEIAAEVSNIIKEILKRGFPEELLSSVVLEAVESKNKK